jgi:hypothetical protein
LSLLNFPRGYNDYDLVLAVLSSLY